MNISLQEFREMLVRHGLIDSSAIDDAEGYDFGSTLNKTARVYGECVAVSRIREMEAQKNIHHESTKEAKGEQP